MDKEVTQLPLIGVSVLPKPTREMSELLDEIVTLDNDFIEYAGDWEYGHGYFEWIEAGVKFLGLLEKAYADQTQDVEVSLKDVKCVPFQWGS